MSRRPFLILLVSAASLCPASPPNWDRWQFLIGDWIGEGSGQPGQGTGGFSLQPDLEGRVLVRKNRADYPAAKDRPAFSHQDLMVVYPEGLRFPDECCRHKALDLIGDLALIGKPLLGHVIAERAGHAMHFALVNRIMSDPTLYEIVSHDQPITTAAHALVS